MYRVTVSGYERNPCRNVKTMMKKEWYEIQRNEMKQIKNDEMIKIKSNVSKMNDIEILEVMEKIEELSNIIKLIEKAILLYTRYPTEHIEE